jgi:hypothetical protein
VSNKVAIKNKDYVRCSSCNSYLLYCSDILDEDGNFVPLDTNGKHHFCNAVHRMLHEERVLKDLQSRLAFANKVEFSSIQLELIDVTDESNK